MSGTWIWPTCWEWISVWMGEPGCFKKFFNFVQICTWPFTKFLTKTVWIWTRPHLLLPRVLVYPLTWVCRQLPGEHVVLKSMWAESHVCFFCLLQCCGNPVLYSPPPIPIGPLGILGIPTNFQPTSNQIPTNFWPDSDQLLTKFRADSKQILTKFQVDSKWIPTKFQADSIL